MPEESPHVRAGFSFRGGGKLRYRKPLFEKAPQLSDERHSEEPFSVAIATRKQTENFTLK